MIWTLIPVCGNFSTKDLWGTDSKALGRSISLPLSEMELHGSAATYQHTNLKYKFVFENLVATSSHGHLQLLTKAILFILYLRHLHKLYAERFPHKIYHMWLNIFVMYSYQTLFVLSILTVALPSASEARDFCFVFFSFCFINKIQVQSAAHYVCSRQIRSERLNFL